ncbi:MAG: MG2 domain-containing protein, partial [Kofleriaceae bacterium]
MPIDSKQAGPALTIAPSDPAEAGELEAAELSELPARDAQALLARLEPLPDVSVHPAPPLRAPSAAPPRSGAVQPIAFVVPAGKPVGDAPHAAAQPALAPPQITPQGDVLGDPEVQIRFSESMVPVAALGEVAAPPAEIAPSVAGTWRWVDTRLLSFRAEAPGLPRSTSYVVRVPAGTKALTGATLPQIAEARFTVSSVSLRGAFPHAPLRPDSAVALAFDQRIDPAHIAKVVRIARRGGPPIPFHVIALDEARARWQRNPALRASAMTWPDRHQVLIAPDAAWPAGAELQVTLPANTRSLEGPNVTTREQRATFDVVPAFAVRGISCDFGAPSKRARCSANGYMQLQFTNHVQEASYRSIKVQLANRPFEDHRLSGNSVPMSAPSDRGSYEIAIGDGLIDIYDQPFVGPRRISFSTTAERHEPTLEAPRGLIVLDPRFQIPQWVVYGQAISSMRIQLFAVEPADFFAFSAYEAGDRAKPPGKRIYDHTFSVGARHGANARVDLRPALDAAGLGHVVAIATAVPAASRTPEEFERKVTAWIQVSKLGLAARIDGERAHAWVHRIATDRDLAPLAGVTTSLLVENSGAGPAVTTADDGHATLELLPRVERKPTDDVPSALLLASSGGDSTFATIGSQHERAIRSADARWYVTDDRFTYRPGEKLYVKGWVRWSTGGVNPDLELPAAGEQVAYALNDARGNRLASCTTQLTERGGFDLAIDLPSNANLGTAMLALSTRQRSYRHPISIQEFRTPAYAVTLNDDVTHAGAAPLVLGERIEMAVEAKYYAGGGLPGANLAWSASLTAASYRPPGWDRFTFSPGPHDFQWRDLAVRAEAQTALSAASRARVVLGIAALPMDRPSLLSVNATITDVDRQRIRASSRQILVHPASYYVGVRARPRSHELEVVVTDVDGKPVAGVPIAVDVTGALASERHRKDPKSTDQQHCQLISGDVPAVCTWAPRKGFAYLAVATIQDPRGRTNRARYELPFYVADRTADLAVIAERTSYRAGEVAKLEIRSKTFPATAIVSFARNGVIAQQRVELAGESTTVELPIEERYLENVHVLVDRWARRADLRDSSNAPLPELRSAALDLQVDLDSARLEVTTRPRTPRVAPGAKATFEVEVKRAGQPIAGAEVALLVVDEAVLALSGRSHADPVAPFFAHIAHGAVLRDTVSLVNDAGDDLDGAPGFSRFSLDSGMRHSAYGFGRGTGGGMGGSSAGSAGSAAIVARKDFRPTAAFSPRLRTDARGKVALTVDMPDSLTRFRVVALAAAQTRYFGRAESTIATQRTVNARTV